MAKMAKIESDLAICPRCMERDYKISSKTKEYKTSRGKATLIKGKCRKCGKVFEYFTQIFIEKTINFVEDISLDEEIKEKNYDKRENK